MKDSTRNSCPLCSRTLDSHGDLRVHLMVEHRKSAVVEEYVDGIEQTPPAP